MSLTFTIIGVLLLLSSYFCCVLPVIPGPLMAYVGMLSLLLTDHRPSWPVLLGATAVVAVACILDYVVPALSAKQFKCSRAGVVGCFLGSIFGFFLGTIASLFCTIFVGAFVLMLALLIGPFVGTVLGELFVRRTVDDALKGGVGAILGYVVVVGLKLFSCLIVTILFFWVWLGS